MNRRAPAILVRQIAGSVRDESKTPGWCVVRQGDGWNIKSARASTYSSDGPAQVMAKSRSDADGTTCSQRSVIPLTIHGTTV